MQAHDRYVFGNFIRQWITLGLGLLGLVVGLRGVLVRRRGPRVGLLFPLDREGGGPS